MSDGVESWLDVRAGQENKEFSREKSKMNEARASE